MYANIATSHPHVRNTVTIFGSPHEDGVCARWLHTLQTQVPSMFVYHCYKAAPAPCDDCRKCYRAPRCVNRDMDPLYDALESANRLIFLTPVYNRSFPAPMKAALDRLQCYWAARFMQNKIPPVAIPKEAALLTVCGSTKKDGPFLSAQLAPLLTVLNAEFTAEYHLQGADFSATEPFPGMRDIFRNDNRGCN